MSKGTRICWALSAINWFIALHLPRSMEIVHTEESDTIPANNGWMIVDKIPPLEPVLSNIGEQPSTKVGDATSRHQEVHDPSKPNSLRKPTENVVRASSLE